MLKLTGTAKQYTDCTDENSALACVLIMLALGEMHELKFELSEQNRDCKLLAPIELLLNRSKIKPAYLKFIHALALIKRIIEQIINNHPTYRSLEKLKPSIIRLSKGYNVNTPPAAPPHAFNLCNQIIHTVFEGTHYADFTPTRS